MSLAFKYAAKDQIPAGLAHLYGERDGAWVLEVEGGVDKNKLDEFRANNVTLRQELETLQTRFAGIDPEAVRKLADEKRQLEEAQALKAGEFEKVLEARLKAVKGEHEKAVGALAAERDALNARLATIQIDQAVVGEASQRGLRATALPDITARARQTFRLVNGVPQAFEGDGQTPRAGRDGATPLSLAEWLDTQVSEAPHLFEANAGSGAAGHGSGGVGSGSGKNPFRKETWNLTDQMRLQKRDPQLAARLKAAA